MTDSEGFTQLKLQMDLRGETWFDEKYFKPMRVAAAAKAGKPSAKIPFPASFPLSVAPLELHILWFSLPLFLPPPLTTAPHAPSHSSGGDKTGLMEPLPPPPHRRGASRGATRAPHSRGAPPPASIAAETPPIGDGTRPGGLTRADWNWAVAALGRNFGRAA
jgi:hypothetical protein